jgi:hypothetical protein
MSRACTRAPVGPRGTFRYTVRGTGLTRSIS